MGGVDEVRRQTSDQRWVGVTKIVRLVSKAPCLAVCVSHQVARHSIGRVGSVQGMIRKLELNGSWGDERMMMRSWITSYAVTQGDRNAVDCEPCIVLGWPVPYKKYDRGRPYAQVCGKLKPMIGFLAPFDSRGLLELQAWKMGAVVVQGT